MSQIQEWLNENSQRSFPFLEPEAAASDPIPRDLIVDLRLFVTGSTEATAYLSSLSYNSGQDIYTLTFSYTSGGEAISGSIPRRNNGVSKVYQKQTISAGIKVALFTPGPRWDDVNWIISQGSVKNWAVGDSGIDPSTIFPGPRTFRRIVIYDGGPSPDPNSFPYNSTQKLAAGYNISLGSENTEELSPERLDRSNDNSLFISAIPGAGGGFPPLTALPSASLDYISSINGVNSEDFQIQFTDCLRGAVLDNTPNTIQILSDCLPCCDCSNYQNESNAIGRRSAKVKDLCNQLNNILETAETLFNEGLKRISLRKSPIVRVQNVRVEDDKVSFSVYNVSAVPLYAYVGMKVLQGQNDYDLLGPTETVQPGYVAIPQMPLNSYESPGSTFPSDWTGANSQYQFTVGALTGTNAFAPIQPGGFTEVVLKSRNWNHEVRKRMFPVPDGLKNYIPANLLNLDLDFSIPQQYLWGTYGPGSSGTPAGLYERLYALLFHWYYDPIDSSPLFSTTDRSVAATGLCLEFASVGVYGFSRSFPCRSETVIFGVLPANTPSVLSPYCVPNPVTYLSTAVPTSDSC